MCWASAWPWLLLLFLLSLCLSSNIGESQDSPPQDCPLGGQSVGGESWYLGISTLPTLVITLFSNMCGVIIHSERSNLNIWFFSFHFWTSWTLSKRLPCQSLPALCKIVSKLLRLIHGFSRDVTSISIGPEFHLCLRCQSVTLCSWWISTDKI